MPTKKIEVEMYDCLRCGKTWTPRGYDETKKLADYEKPKVCPNCNSHLWDTPRKNKIDKSKMAKRVDKK